MTGRATGLRFWHSVTHALRARRPDLLAWRGLDSGPFAGGMLATRLQAAVPGSRCRAQIVRARRSLAPLPAGRRAESQAEVMTIGTANISSSNTTPRSLHRARPTSVERRATRNRAGPTRADPSCASLRAPCVCSACCRARRSVAAPRAACMPGSLRRRKRSSMPQYNGRIRAPA